MKRYLAAFVMIILAFCMGLSFAENAPNEGWTIPETNEMTEEVRSLFSKAIEGLLGVNYEPLAFLGEKDGVYCFFCRAAVVYPGAVPYYVLVYVTESGVQNIWELWMDKHAEPPEDADEAKSTETDAEVIAEVNTEYRPDLYPYVVHTESASWYLSQADIDALGMDEMLAGLQQVLVNQEADFADARKALEGYIGDVPPVTICTDFSDHAEISKNSSAYYNGRENFIKVFHDWKHCDAALMHEYVHYLTLGCAPVPLETGFWAEGVAEYVSRILCKNRGSRSVNMGASEEEVAFFREKGAWDSEEECLDEKMIYFALAELYRKGYMTGESYFAVSNEVIERTDTIQNSPKPQQLSMHEAASMVAYLIETYGREAVFSNWNSDPEQMEAFFGMSFQDIYSAWAEWNTRQCKELGIEIE